MMVAHPPQFMFVLVYRKSAGEVVDFNVPQSTPHETFRARKCIPHATQSKQTIGQAGAEKSWVGVAFASPFSDRK